MTFIIKKPLADIINWTIVIAGTLSGFAHSNTKLFYKNFLLIFVTVSLAMNGMALFLTGLIKLFAKPCQPNPPKKPKYLSETLETLSSYYVFAFIAAWPYTNYQLGVLKAYVWDLKDSIMGDSIFLNALFVLFFFLFIDFFNYWKHYLLHTPMLFIFHEPHHQYANPSVQAVFAITPVESLWSFGLMYLDCLDIANEFPLCIWFHGSLLIGFAFLNLYLHCGYQFDCVEYVLQRLLINSSYHHNYHHLKCDVNYGELGVIWDWIRNTGATFYNTEHYEKTHPKFARNYKNLEGAKKSE